MGSVVSDLHANQNKESDPSKQLISQKLEEIKDELFAKIDNGAKFISSFDYSLTKSPDEVVEENHVDVDFEVFEILANKFKEDAIELFETKPDLNLTELISALCSEFYCSDHKVTVKDSKLVIEQMKKDDADLEYQEVLSQPFDDNVLSLFIIKGGLILICKKATYVFPIQQEDSKVKGKLIQVFRPYHENFICPYSFDDDVCWCYWESEKKVIKFSHDSKFEIPCQNPPKAMTTHHSNIFCVAGDCGGIWCINASNNTFENLTSKMLFLATIDHVTVVSHVKLLLWSIASNRVVVLTEASGGKWKASSKMEWKFPTKVLKTSEESNLGDAYLVPAVKKENGGENEEGEEKFVFLYIKKDTAFRRQSSMT